MAHSPRLEGANPAPGSRHKKNLRGWQLQQAGVGVGGGPGPLRNAGIGSPASSHHCTTPKWLPNSDRPFGDRPMTITMAQIQLRDCDYAIAMPGMAHRAVPGSD